MDIDLRPLSLDDIDALLVLGQAAALADGAESAPTREMLESQFTMPGIDITKMAWALPGPSGTITATVSAIPLVGDGNETVHIGFEVHPDARGCGLEERIIRFAEEHGALARTRPDLPGVLHVGVKGEQLDRARMIERLGYHAVRWFLKLAMDRGQEPIEWPVPDGLVIEQGAQHLEQVYAALDESFRDHWNQPHFTLDQFRHMVGSLGGSPLLILLARTQDGDPAGACLTRVSAERNEQHGVAEGEVAILGVRRTYRRRGLGRALLGRSVAWLWDQGMTTSTIDVDAASPTGANRLYESVGFRERRRSVVYHKAIP